MVVYKAMLRRTSVLIFALSLAVLAPVPLSACALLVGLPGPCSCQSPQEQCGGMGMHAAALEIRGPRHSCCRVIGAPLPEAQSQVSASAQAAPLCVAATLLDAISYTPQHPTAQTLLGPSPPDRHPWLCVFRI